MNTFFNNIDRVIIIIAAVIIGCGTVGCCC